MASYDCPNLFGPVVVFGTNCLTQSTGNRKKKEEVCLSELNFFFFTDMKLFFSHIVVEFDKEREREKQQKFCVQTYLIFHCTTFGIFQVFWIFVAKFVSFSISLSICFPRIWNLAKELIIAYPRIKRNKEREL